VGRFIEESRSVIGEVTEQGYRYNLGYFLDWLEREGAAPVLGSVDRPLLVKYIAFHQRRPKRRGGAGTPSSHTVHTYVRPIRTFLRWCVAEGLYPSDPLAGGRRGIMPRLGRRLPKTAQPGDIEILLRGCEGLEPVNRRDRVIVLLAADTGLRTGELCRLALGDLRLAAGYLVVQRGKWDVQRVVPFGELARGAIVDYLELARPALTQVAAADVKPSDVVLVSERGEPLRPNGVYQAACRIYARGGGEGRFGLHRLRHNFGTEAVRAGMHPRVSQAIMGHADPKSQLVYQHPTTEDLLRAHAKASPLRVEADKDKRGRAK
jgi:site-specific recombinase XerD